VAALRAQFEAGQHLTESARERALRKEKLFHDLDEARMARSVAVDNHWDNAAAVAKYAAAFAAFGLELVPGRTDELARRIIAQDAEVRDAVVVALHDWAYVAALGQTPWSATDLLALAQAADNDPWRYRYRAAVTANDRQALRDLSAEARRSSLPPSSLILLARSLDVLGEHEEALALLRFGRGRHPTDFWLHFQLGFRLRLHEHRTPVEVEEAIGCYCAALALRPAANIVHNNLGGALLAKNQVDEAVAACQKAIELDPNYAGAHNNLGNALQAKKQRDLAITEYQKAIELDPNYAGAHNNLGNALQAKKQWDEAIAEHQKAIDLDPQNAKAHNNLGNALRAKKQWDEAIAEYQKAIELDPKYAWAHNNLGLALRAKNQLDEAIAEFKKAIAIDSEFAHAHGNLGGALHAKNQLDEAIAAYRKVIELDPKDAKAHHLGKALMAKNQLDEAIAAYQKAIELDPKYAGAHSNLGLAFQAKNQLDEAIAEHQKAIELDPKLAGLHYNLGNALQAKKQLDEAIAAYKKAIDLDPKFAPAHNSLGLALMAKNQVDQAIAAYKKAIDVQPDHAEAHCNLAYVLRSQGQLAASLDVFMRGHALGSKRNDWRYSSAKWVADAERLVMLEAKLLDILAGKAVPVDSRERLGLLEVCRLQRRYVAAARLYADAFSADAKLANELKVFHRYNAACAAVLAAAGKGTDADKLDDKERAHFRNQALQWLRADLTLWSKLLEDGQVADHQATRKMLQHWQSNTDLAGVRDAPGLQKLSAEEQEAWRQQWADVAQLHKKTDNAK
jgi:tetratricopeptide (TPR) repeat protein